MNMVWKDAGEKLADGSYYATYSGHEIAPPRQWQGKEIGEGVAWKWAVASGPHTGRTCQRITGRTPMPATACGKVVAGLLGRTPAVGEDVGASLQDCVGKRYLVVVQGGKVDSVALPPQ
jgi:hypothetical protein